MYINIISFFALVAENVVFFSPIRICYSKISPLQGARQNGGGGAYLSACLGRLRREVGCTTSAYLDIDEQFGRLGKTGLGDVMGKLDEKSL